LRRIGGGDITSRASRRQDRDRVLAGLLQRILALAAAIWRNEDQRSRPPVFDRLRSLTLE